MNDFCETYNLSSLITESTCYKNLENPSCIDLSLTNFFNSFQNSSVVETGLSDFHRVIVTVMKTSFQKLPPKIRGYRDYSNYDNNMFRVSLFNKLSKLNTEAISIACWGLDLNKFIIRGNHLPFMNKVFTNKLSKEMMHRTRLRNNFLRNRSDENKKKYSKQRNYCVSLLRKTKKNYYNNLNEKKITATKFSGKQSRLFSQIKLHLMKK